MDYRYETIWVEYHSHHWELAVAMGYITATVEDDLVEGKRIAKMIKEVK